MIDKFKKGGLNTSILAKIQQLPKELLQQVMQAFSQWALQKGVNIQKLQKDPNALEQALGQFMQELQSQKTQAARHGAKLNYLKSLKNKCAEDEELVYFKKGGSIDCGCKKKEVGGPIKKDNSLDARNKFIAKYRSKKEQARIDSLSEADYFNPNKKTEESSDRRTAEQKMPDSLKKKIIKKSCGGSAVAKFKAKCGSKLKKHQLGGSLNGIPFMQKGSSFKEAWNNARKNKVRYFNYNGRMYNSKAAGIDTEYESFVDNINEASAQLPTNKSPKHLGWEENNPLSNELRGKDREIYQQGTESTIPGIIVTGNFRTKKTPTRSSVKSEVYYNMPLGRIEYIGRDGLRYWMAQSDANGQWYYDKIENSTNYGPKYHKAVPEGYIIPGTNTPITKNSKIGKIGLGLKKKWMKNGGSLNGIPFYQEGTFKGGIQVPRGRTQEEVDAINTQNKNNAKGLFKGMISGQIVPTLPNIGRMISSAFNGWVEPETAAITGVAPTPTFTKATNAWEALLMVKAMKAAKLQKPAKVITKVEKTPEQIALIKANRAAGIEKAKATRARNIKDSNVGIEIPDIPNYQELFDTYNKMTKASRLNILNILDKLPADEKANVMKVMMSNPDKYIGFYYPGNVTPQRAASAIRTIRQQLPGEYTPLRVKSLDQTHYSMRSGIGILTGGDNTTKTAGFKRTTKVY